MAKVHFNESQPIQALSGTLGNLTFRTVNGHTHVFQRPELVLPKNPTRKQRAQFKRQTLINNCIHILQSQYEDIQEAMAMRPIIKDRLKHLYNKYVTDIKAPTKLQKAIMTEYYAHFSLTSTGQYRCKVGPTSVHSRRQSTANQPSINRQS